MAIASKKVYVTSSVLYAFIDRAHPKHPQAAAYFRYFAQEKYQIFTSYLDVENAYKEIFQKISPSLARDFLRGLILSSINILYPTESDTKAALKALINYRSSELDFKASQMSVLATRNNVNQVCTFDYLHPLFGLNAFYLPI
jgi:predicted nucleic acid-binding protein